MSYPGLHPERRRATRASTPVDPERQPLLSGRNNNYNGNYGGHPIRPSGNNRPGCCTRKWWPYALASATAMLLIIILSLDSISPTQYGLVYNRITGVVGKDTYEYGLHFIGPFKTFIKFPSNYNYIEFSRNEKADHAPIQARTGRDRDDPDSGGQPIGISVAFTYQMDPKTLFKVYQNFALDYEKRYIQFVIQTISDATQRFHPSAFWMERSVVAESMREDINAILHKQGFVHVRTLQLLRLEFLPAYERTIVGIQLVIQQRTTNEYKQQVVGVLKDIDIKESETNAKIAKINAVAEAKSMLNLNSAAAIAFNITQTAKADAYSKFAAGLGLTDNALLLKYIRVRNVRQHVSDNMTIALEHPIARLRSVAAAK